MDGRSSLDIARELAGGATEAHRRSAAGRAYYALMLEVRDRLVSWDLTRPARDRVHDFARLTLIYAADPDLRQIGLSLEQLGDLRRRADYDLGPSRDFSDPRKVQRAVRDAGDAIAVLDRIDRDPTRRAAAIRSIRP